ncbi:MAG: hypothetical protein JWO80_647 [Bryobacterales bacterium]|nr:hypothetical protein [Bryobacterales bacterium]
MLTYNATRRNIDSTAQCRTGRRLLWPVALALFLFMLQTAASRIRTRGIDRRAAFFNQRNLPVHVHHESRPVRDAHLWNQNAIKFRKLPVVIADQRKLGAKFFRPMRQSRYKIRADRQHLRIVCGEFANTRLVGGKFLRSTTGKCCGEERQNHILLAAIVGQLDLFAAGIALCGDGEIGRGIAHFQVRLRRRDILRERRSRQQGECE